MKVHRYIEVKGVRFYNRNKLKFNLWRGYGYIHIVSDEIDIHITTTERTLDEIEQDLNKLGFYKSEK